MDIQTIRSKLEQAWNSDTAHEAYEGQASSSMGQCYVSALVAYLLLEPLCPKLIRGDIGRGDNDHYWLEIDGKVLDLTADQFDELDLPPVVWGTYEEFPMYKPLKEDTGFKRFLLLARRCGIRIEEGGDAR